MIKNLKIEIFIFIVILTIVFFYDGLDKSIYHLVNSYEKSLDGKYLKNFFVQITVLGDSIWFFLFLLLLFLSSYLLKNKIAEYKKINLFCLFLFIGLLVTGTVTQIIKHIVGRPRPNYAWENNIFDFSFFNLDSSFHSFPSGHTSTIFFIAILLSVFSPKLKYFYYAFASIIAISRIVVGAHFLLDVLGGIVVAFIGFKLTVIISNYFKTNINLDMYKIKNNYLFFQSLIILLFLNLLLAVGSYLDLYISSQAYQGDRQFYLQSLNLIVLIFRKGLLPLTIIYLFIFPFLSLFLPVKAIYLNYNLKLKECVYIFFFFFFNLIVIVNLLLKDMWGRARPNDIIQFGGKESFTPWFEPSTACDNNCSFISGDASVGFSIIILYFITKNKFFLWLSLLFGFSLGLIRVMEGGHFISDILMANFIIFVSTFMQFYFYNKYFNKNVS